jgi:hypothetical protein
VDDYLNHPSIYSSIHPFPIWDEIFSSRGGPQNVLTAPLGGVKKGKKKKKERKKEKISTRKKSGVLQTSLAGVQR